MNQVDEAKLAAGLDKRDERKNNRTLQNRYFRGTVTAIENPANTPGNLQIQVQRVGESGPDGNWYPWTAATPPIIGQDVVLAWQDDYVGHADVPLQSPGLSASRVYRTAAVNPTGPAFSIIGMDTIDFDGLGIAIVGAGTIQGFNVIIPGTYLVRARASIVSIGTAIRLFVGICLNGTEVRRGYDNTNAGPHGGPVAGAIQCVAGDLIQLGVFVGATVGLEVGSVVCYLEVEWKP